jgi:hypothetical protein
MALEDIGDRLKDQLIALWGRVQESTLYNNFKEQYDTWPTIAQKAVVFGASFLLAFMILSIPYSSIDSATTSIEEFTEYRSLLRDLLRVGRAVKEPSPLPAAIPAAELQSQVQAMLGEFGLVPEQLGGVQPLLDRPAGSLAATVIHQEGVALNLKKLNLMQVIDIGYRLQTISGGVKLTGLDMTANNDDNHYYDVSYRLVSFSLPQYGQEGDEETAPRGRAPPAKGSRGSSEEDL